MKARIADAIVVIVEHADAPVAIARIMRDVPGFAELNPLAPT